MGYFIIHNHAIHTQSFGVVMSEEQMQLIGRLENELSSLLELIAQLKTES